MMRARVNLITADPDRMADTIGYIKTSVRPASGASGNMNSSPVSVPPPTG